MYQKNVNTPFIIATNQMTHFTYGRFPAGSTATYDALMYAREEMFKEENGMRPDVSQAAIVVTDGTYS